jgi:type I restriction enzyme S subunit
MSFPPASWGQTTIGEVCQVIRGVTFKKGDAVSIAAPDYLPILRATNIDDGRLLLDAEMTYVPERFVRENQRLHLGDVVVATSSGSASVVGKSAQLRHPWEGAFGAFCGVIRPSSLVAPGFLAHFVCSHEVRDQWRQKAQGTNINNLKVSDIASTHLPMPPLAEQREIVASVEEQFSRLDAGVKMIQDAKTRLGRLRRQIFSGSVTLGEEMSLGEILLDIEAGRSFRTTGVQATPEQWGVIKVSAMTWGRFIEEENKAVPDGVPVNPQYEIRPGDVLLSRANTSEYVGAAVLVGHCRSHLLLSDKSMRLHVVPGINKAWLTYALSSPWLRDQMSSVATGTSDSMRNISQEKVRALRLRVPTTEEQRSLAEGIDRNLTALGSVWDSIASGLIRSTHLRSSILKAAFSGRLAPGDAVDDQESLLLDRLPTERVALNREPSVAGRLETNRAASR